MEYVDIYDEKGNLTGQKKLKDAVHRDGDWHKIIQVWVINSRGEMLIQKRATSKVSFPNYWDTSCVGHIRAGDDSLATARRELWEELGIKAKTRDLELLYSYSKKGIEHDGRYRNNQHNDVYLANIDIPLKKIILEPQEVDEVKLIYFKVLERHIQKETMKFVFHKNEYRQLFRLLDQRFKP